MTCDEILKMEAGREMDALVAEKVMGWKPSILGNWPWQQEPPGVELGEKVTNVPHYSSDISAAWQVVEKINRGAFITIERNGFDRSEWVVEIGGGAEASADTAPLAICRAALLAVMQCAE